MTTRCPRSPRAGESEHTSQRQDLDASRARVGSHLTTNVGRLKGDSPATVRRIKCDETRPACLRCTSTRRACDGYAPESSCSSFFSSPSGFSPGSLLLLNQVDRGPSLNIHPCDQSARSFSFFAQYTCHQLAGFFESPFWERLVLQTTHQEPAIRHAVTAIGSLHMQQKGNLTLGPLNTEKTFALVQYNLAIRHLLTPRISKWQRGDNRAPIDVCLILSILFTCFENMQGHHKAAGCHIRGGAKLLIEAVYDAGSGLLRREVLATQSRQNPYVPLEVLANFFAGLNDDAAMVSQLSGRRFPLPLFSCSEN